VAQLVAGNVTVHRFGLPGDLNTTDPVAAAGSPSSASVAAVPCSTLLDAAPFTDTVNGGVVAAVIVSDTVFVEVDAVKLASAGVNAALIGVYEPTGSAIDVAQLVAGSVIVHRFGLPGELNTTDPVAAPGKPDSASVAAVPCSTVADAHRSP